MRSADGRSAFGVEHGQIAKRRRGVLVRTGGGLPGKAKKHDEPRSKVKARG